MALPHVAHFAGNISAGQTVVSVSGTAAAITTTSGCVRLSGCAARRAALRLVSVTSGCKTFLLSSAEREVSPTIGTGNLFVAITHWDGLLFYG